MTTQPASAERVNQDVSPFRGPYAKLLRFSFFNASTWLIGLGTPMVLLATELGANSFEVGLAYSFVFLLLPIQIFATAFLPSLGYKKQIMLAWAARGSSLIIPFILALLAPAEPSRWMVQAMILSAFLFSFFRTFGSCALPPMMYAMLPEDVRGKFFSTDQAIIGLAGIVTLVLFAGLFSFFPTYTAFATQYGYALVAVVMTIYYMGKIPDPPKPKETAIRDILIETPRLCLQKSPFRQYLIFMVVSSLMGTAFVPLVTYYLKVEMRLGMAEILVYTALQYCGAILGTAIMRERIDKVGARVSFRISLILNACISTYWFFLVSGLYPPLRLGLPVAYFLFGIAASQWIASHLKYIPRVCDTQRRALHISIHAAAVGIIGGIAPMLWGYVVKVPGTRPGIQADVFAGFFFALLTAQLILFLYVPLLSSRHRDRPSMLASATLIRPFRYIGQLINVIPEADKKDVKE